MNRNFKFVIIGALLLTGAVTLNANNYTQDIIEDATDAYNNIGLNIKNIQVGESEIVKVSKTYVQHGTDGSRQFLRFATAVSGPINNIKYTRVVEGLGTKETPVTTVYKGISGNGGTYYYNGTDAVLTEDDKTNDFYWACYTIEFTTDTYKTSNITAYITVDSSNSEEPITSEQKVTSFYEQTEQYSQQLIYSVNDLERLKKNLANGKDYSDKTITLMNDITVDNVTGTYLTINSRDVTIDLNGHKLSISTDSEYLGASAAIQINNGSKLTIADYSKEANGELAFEYTGPTASNANQYASNAITVSSGASLIVNSGKIINYTARITGIVRNAIDSLNNGSNGNSITINNGTVYCVNGYGIRQFCNSSESTNVTLINNGTIKGTYPVVVQVPTANHCAGKLTINGGEFVGYVPWTNTTSKPVYVFRTNCGISGCEVKDVEIELNNGFTSSDIHYSNSYDLSHANIKTLTEVATFAELEAKLAAGLNVKLTNNIEFERPLNLKGGVIDGNGFTITQGENCVNNIALISSEWHSNLVTIKNVTFDGIKTGAAIRTTETNIVIDNCSFINAKHTEIQGYLRLTAGGATITNCKFLNNEAKMLISFGYDATDANAILLIENCEFENNLVHETAVVYYVGGNRAILNNNKFLNNECKIGANGSTVYLGFTKRNVVTNNVFMNNSVISTGTSTRTSAALMIGNDVKIKGNAFVNNHCKNANNSITSYSVLASVFYADIDLSGNYWGGEAPVKGQDYAIEYPNRHSVIIKDYLTSYDF